MITKYATYKWNSGIHALECTRETDLSVWVLTSSKSERRQAKDGTFEVVHDTWEAAHEYLLNRANENMDRARSRLEHAESELAEVLLMTKGPA